MRLSIPAGARAVYSWDGWTLYELPPRADDSILWWPFRLMLPPDTPARWGLCRAYDLRWNPVELRFQKSGAHRRLASGRPDLSERVELFLALSYGPEWLRDVMGVNESDVAAERLRLAALAAQRRSRRRGRRSAAPAAL